MPPKDTMVMTMESPAAVQLDQSLTTSVTRFSFPRQLEVEDYVTFVSTDCFALTNNLTLINYFTKWDRFLLHESYPLITMECCTGKLFYTKIILWVRRKFILLNVPLLWCSLGKKPHGRAHTHTQARTHTHRYGPICRRHCINHERCVDNSEQTS
jgi:hypothetical protein